MPPTRKSTSARSVRGSRKPASVAFPRILQFAQNPSVRPLLPLIGGLAVTAIAVWQLRMEWAKDSIAPWILLTIGMATSAIALRPTATGSARARGESRAVETPIARQRLIAGRVLFALAAVLTSITVIRLWPNPGEWRGTPVLWFTAIVFLLCGAWLLGSPRKGSPPASVSIRLWADTMRNRWLEIAAVGAVLALAVFLRTYRLDVIPPGIFVDETNGALDAVKILDGRLPSPFGTGWYQVPSGYFYVMALLLKLTGTNWLGLKMASLIPAIVTVPCVYLLARELFGPAPALFAMLFVAASRWHLTMSRWGWVEVTAPLLQVLSMFLLVRALRSRRLLDYALSGLIAGLSLYTYLSARLALIAMVLYLIVWLLIEPSHIADRFRHSWRGVLVLALAAVIAVAPLAVTFIKDPFAFGNRTSEVSILRDVRTQGSLAPLALNVGDSIRLLLQHGDHNGRHNLPGEPMIDPFSGLLLAVGIAYALSTIRDHRSVLLLLWLIVSLAASFMGARAESPQAFRSLSAVPAIAMLSGVALAKIVGHFIQGLRRAAGRRQHANLAPWVAGGVIAVFLSGATLWDSGIYFGPQASSPDVIGAFSPVETRVAFDTLDALRSERSVYLSTGLAWTSQLRYLVFGEYASSSSGNTLDNPPYDVITAQDGFPLKSEGKPTTVLLESQYASMQDYFASFYPDARMQLLRLPYGAPLYFRIDVPAPAIKNLLGLEQHLTAGDGQLLHAVATQVRLPTDISGIQSASWNGLIRIEDGGEYILEGGGGLQIFIDGAPWSGHGFLGRGLYDLSADWSAPTGSSNPRLIWQPPNQDRQEVPSDVLFHVETLRSGLRASYFDNTGWNGAPVFRQLVPFLLLGWPDPPIPTSTAFSARLEGFLTIPKSSLYEFHVEADDGARVLIDGALVGEGLDPSHPNSFVFKLPLEQGKHAIQIDYVQLGGGNGLKVLWRVDGGDLLPIPPLALSPPVQ